jgi:hypothetical protein
MGQSAKQKSDKKIVIEHLYEAIAKMRAQQGHNSVRAQARFVVEILKPDYSVSIPGSLRFSKLHFRNFVG